MKPSKIIEQQILAGIAAAVENAIGLDAEQSRRAAAAAFTALQHQFGGQHVYIRAQESEARHAAIRAAFTGNNHQQVMHRFGISLATLYRAIGRKA